MKDWRERVKESGEGCEGVAITQQWSGSLDSKHVAVPRVPHMTPDPTLPPSPGDLLPGDTHARAGEEEGDVV